MLAAPSDDLCRVYNLGAHQWVGFFDVDTRLASTLTNQGENMRFRPLDEDLTRPPTWAERERMVDMRESGVDDVYLGLDQAGTEFWNALHMASEWHLVDGRYPQWDAWAREYRYAMGLHPFSGAPKSMFEKIVVDGIIATKQAGQNKLRRSTVGERISAVEHLIDLAYEVEVVEAFRVAVNDKAQWLRVAIMIEGTRFVPRTSETLHREVVQPTLLLLSAPGLESVDGLYRKAFDRYFAHDYAGAITAASSAVEEMLRNGLGESGGQLQPLLMKAQSRAWILPAVAQMAVKLDALRSESDAHTSGTDDPGVAMLAIHVAGSVLLHLAETRDRLA